MSAAEVLREAAVSMRQEHGPDHPRHEMWWAMAALLGAQAQFMEEGGDFSDIEGGGDANALAVARAYLAATR